MGRKLPYTPNSRITSAIRQLWLRSREHLVPLQRSGYRCECCGVKASKAKGREVKLHVHHIDGIDWDGVREIIRERVLVSPDRLQALCVDCHNKQHSRVSAEDMTVNECGDEGEWIKQEYD